MGLGDPQPSLLNVSVNPGTAPAGGSGNQADKQLPPKPEEAKFAPEKWSNEYALAVVVNDINRASQYLQQNFYPRWDENDRLYNANIEQRVWEGTNTPRASIGVKLVQQQLESVMPYLRQGIFQSADGIFFDAYPRPGTSPDLAIQNRELIAAQLDDIAFEESCDQIWRSMARYGTGIGKLSWCRWEESRDYWADEEVASRVIPLGKYSIPIGPKIKTKKRKSKKVLVSRPDFYYISIRDFYMDPSHKLPWVPGAQWVAQRSMLTREEVRALGEQDDTYRLPGDVELLEHLKRQGNPQSAQADSSKQRASQESDIRENFPIQGSVDPAKALLEVIEYWTADRLVTLLERKWIIRNIANPYKFIPFVSCNFIDMTDQFYGKGIPEVLEDEQKLQAGLINSHLDEVSLNIHGVKVVQSGSVLNKQQLRPRPGGVIEATSVDAVKELERTPVTGDWFAALQQSQMRAQQYTGISDIVVLGQPSMQTSITRTARGAGTLQNAAMTRIQYLVDRIEQRFIVPVLSYIDQLNQRYLDPSTPQRILGTTNGQEFQTIDIYPPQGDFRFELRAGARMAARQNMLQNLPFLLSTILNPGLIGSLQDQMEKPNAKGIIRDVMEITGWRSRNDWFVPITPQEMQAMMQRQQSPQIVKEQIKNDREQARSDAKAQMMNNQQIADIVKIVIEKLAGHPGFAEAFGGALQNIGTQQVAQDDAQPEEAQVGM